MRTGYQGNRDRAVALTMIAVPPPLRPELRVDGLLPSFVRVWSCSGMRRVPVPLENSDATPQGLAKAIRWGISTLVHCVAFRQSQTEIVLIRLADLPRDSPHLSTAVADVLCMDRL
jgi:hypothetical protein